ncbi:MAG: thioredoxin family protein [Immundisolibacteraceae bacterium]|nr:thioredoxin family protein [Immundisolibacteraceae bacterium]
MIIIRSCLLWLLSVFAVASHAAPVATDHTEVEILAEVSAVVAGEPFWVAFRLEADSGWHTYWSNPGDSGLPSEINWQLPQGWQISDLYWPIPELISTPPFATHAYHGEVLLLAQVTPPASIDRAEVILQGQAAWLVCKQLCLRETAGLTLTLPVSESISYDPINRVRFDATRANWPQTDLQLAVTASSFEDELYLQIDGANQLTEPLHFFPYQGEQVEPAADQRLFTNQTGYQLAMTRSQFNQGSLRQISGVLVNPVGWNGSGQPAGLDINAEVVELTAAPNLASEIVATRNVQSQPSSSTGLNLGLALLMAFIGGAILNLMPCVFPILSIKVLSFIDMAQGNKGHVRRHGLLFALGILMSFWLLSGTMLFLQQAGEQIGWGFQLQSPGFVMGLSLLMLLLALNLFGLFEVGGTMMRLAGNADTGGGYWSSFNTGVLAAAVATPCTAPFMGVALGYALTQPGAVTMLIFTSVALGLAAPYLLLAEMPALLARLPKPGQWMITFRQLLGFPLLATAAWLVWVLGHQQGVDAVALLLLVMVALAMAGWLHGLQQRRGSRRSWIDLALIALLLSQVPLLQKITEPADQVANRVNQSGWEPFDQVALDGYLATGEPLFIDFTAAWCITCQVNKRIALHQPRLAEFFADQGIRTIRADWTRQDPQITAALARVGRNGVPTYLFYDPSGTPHLLPEVLTANIVIDRITVAQAGNQKP